MNEREMMEVELWQQLNRLFSNRIKSNNPQAQKDIDRKREMRSVVKR